MLNFRQTLEEAKKNNIDVLTLEVAYELDGTLEVEISDEEFEKLCSAITRIYLKSDFLSVGNVACYIGFKINSGTTAKSIIERDVYGLWDEIEKEFI